MHPFNPSHFVLHFYLYTVTLASISPAFHPSLRHTQPFSTNFTSPSPKALPRDPFTYDIPYGIIVLRNYGDPIPFVYTYEAITQAGQDIRAHLRRGGPPRISKGKLTYRRGGVQLGLDSIKGQLTWVMWRDALANLNLFVNQYEAVVLSFDVEHEQLGSVAEGFLELA